jgi:hypothetical protein
LTFTPQTTAHYSNYPEADFSLTKIKLARNRMTFSKCCGKVTVTLVFYTQLTYGMITTDLSREWYSSLPEIPS